MSFNAIDAAEKTCEWIRRWFDENGKDCPAVLGISGGKDSSVVAALCARALGPDRVVGVLMPNGVQPDIDVSEELVSFLGIRHLTVNIHSAFTGLTDEIAASVGPLSRQTVINLGPRLRMATVYAVSQSVNGRVANTSNLSEYWVGYSTRYGDSAGDFAPLLHFTVAEVKAIGRAIGLPEHFVEKPPSDGLSGKTDEDNLGFRYAVLDEYIRTGVCPDAASKEKIDRLHRINAFKRQPMPSFEYQPE